MRRGQQACWWYAAGLQRQRLEAAQQRQPKGADFLFLLGYLDWFDGHRPEAVQWFQQARPLMEQPRWVDLFLKAAPQPVAAR